MGFDVSLPQERLEQLLRAAGRAASGRAPQPVLSGLLLTADGDRLTATGYDLSMGVRSETLATVAKGGAVVAPYRTLAALVAALPEGSMVRLKVDGNGSLSVEAGEGRYSVVLSHDPEDFPTLPIPGDVEPIGLPFGSIRRGLAAVAFAASTEESKQVLQGVQFLIQGEDLRLVATDGHRGSVYDLPGIAKAGKDTSFVVPGPAAKELLKLALEDDDLLLVSYTQAIAVFDAGDTTLITNLLAANYPDFAKLVPKTCKVKIHGNRQAIISAVERANVVASAENGAVTLSYTAETGDLCISAANDAGSAADLIAVETDSKITDFKLTISARYLLDALRHVETGQFSIAFNDKNLLKIQPVGSDLHNQLVAPIAVKESKTGK
jgi:DNA polymerase-3 subunit beta